MNHQAYLFIMFIINGILIGILFDIFRILRKSFKTTDIITYIEDIAFWILTGMLTLYFIFHYNHGEIRFYIFIGILFGVILYILSISQYFVRASVSIITFVKEIVLKVIGILIYPFKLLLSITKKILFRPFSFIFINIRKTFTKNRLNLIHFLKKLHKPTKKQA